MQLAEIETTARGDGEAGGEQLGWIEARERLARAQVALAVGEQPLARRGQRAAMADRGQQILQPPPAAPMHVHVAGRNRRQAALCGQFQAVRQARSVAGAAMQLHGEPRALREVLAQPQSAQPRGGRGKRAGGRRQPEREAAIESGFEIRGGERIAAFDGAPSRAGDELTDLRVGALFGRQQYQPQTARRSEIRRR